MPYWLETLSVAAGGACLVALYGRRAWPRLQQHLLMAGATAAVLASALSYFDDWRGQPPSAWLHEHDFYHYYIGAKYFPEVGYMRLYVCTVAALTESANAAEQPTPVVMVRRLEAPTETLSGAALTQAASACRARFSAARWREFRVDIDTLGARVMRHGGWAGVLVDLGNNSPPTWKLSATLLANLLPLHESMLNYWPLVDQVLLFVLVPMVVWRTFGARALLAYGLVYCASPLAYLGWVGGSFGRADWYVALVLGLCALATRRMALAGACFAFASACRVFPALFMLSALVGLCLRGRRHEAWRFLLAAAALLVFMVSASVWLFGLDIWSEFAAVMRLRISPYAANTLGLHKLAACWNVLEWPQFVGGGDALRASSLWRETLAGDAARRSGVTLAVGLGLCVATSLTLRGRALGVGTALGGVVLLFVLLTPFTYYYAVFALLPLGLCQLDGRPRAVSLAVVIAGLLALRVVSVPFAAEMGHEIGFYAVSFQSSRVLLVTLVALLAVLALHDLRAAAARHAAPRAARVALAAAALALLSALYGYRATPAASAYFHDLSTLVPLTASAGVTLNERPATASWPAARFFEVGFGASEQRLTASLVSLRQGHYRASLIATGAPGYGRVSLTLGATRFDLDGQSTNTTPREVALGEVDLDAHSQLVLTARDAAGARFGVSGLVLEPVPAR